MQGLGAALSPGGSPPENCRASMSELRFAKASLFSWQWGKSSQGLDEGMSRLLEAREGRSLNSGPFSASFKRGAVLY